MNLVGFYNTNVIIDNLCLHTYLFILNDWHHTKNPAAETTAAKNVHSNEILNVRSFLVGLKTFLKQQTATQILTLHAKWHVEAYSL